jgi:hypothetical protein
MKASNYFGAPLLKNLGFLHFRCVFFEEDTKETRPLRRGRIF